VLDHVGAIDLVGAWSIVLTLRIFKRSLDKSGWEQSLFNSSLELNGGVMVSARESGARDMEAP